MNVSPKVQEGCKSFLLSTEQLKTIKKLLLDSIGKGLCKRTHDKSTVKCFVTYVQDLPDGTEKGKFIGVEMGCNHVKTYLLTFGENSKYEVNSKSFEIPQNFKISNGLDLFNYLAECLATFMSEQGVFNEFLGIGFTFSFPLQQLSLTKGILTKWTKGFTCSHVVGKDVGLLFQEACDKRGDIRVSIVAVINDTTATLVACSLNHKSCKIGVVIGQGFNICYLENQKNAERFDSTNTGSGKVIINTEMGAFGDDGCLDFIRTPYDRDIDAVSVNVGKQIFEKMVAATSLGELARLLSEKMTKEGHIFIGKGASQLFQRNKLSLEEYIAIQISEIDNATVVKKFLNDVGIKQPSDQDIIDFRYICECVIKRSADLTAAALMTLIEKIDDLEIVIGAEGILYHACPRFHAYVMEKLKKLNSKYKIQIQATEGSSGKGAAIVAATVSKKVFAQKDKKKK